jgi:hypothetical protein
MTGDLTVNGNTTLGSDASDTVTIKAGPVILENATTLSDALEFGTGGSKAVLYNDGGVLRTNNNLMTNGTLIIGYDGTTTNDGAQLFMDYSAGNDAGKFYITTRDNGNEPFIFRQRNEGSSLTYIPLAIGTDQHVAIGNVPTHLVDANLPVFTSELTLYGDLSATGIVRLGGAINRNLIVFSNVTTTDTTSANLYRSGSATLRTDSNFGVGSNLTVETNATIGNNLTVGGTLSLPTQTQSRFFAAPDTSNGIPTFRNISNADLPTVSIGKGGTNSTTALVNGRVMVSTGGAIVESTITTASVTNVVSQTTEFDILSASDTNIELIKSTAGQPPLSGFPRQRSFKFDIPANSLYYYNIISRDNATPTGTHVVLAVSGNRNFTIVQTDGTTFTNNSVYRLQQTYPFTNTGYIVVENVPGTTNIMFGISAIQEGGRVTQYNTGSLFEYRRLK